MDEEYILKDGTLYHAGVKGMKWGKHLPGTEWWKGTTNFYKQHVNRNGSNFQANVYATKESAKKYAGYLKDNTKTIAKAVKNKTSDTWNNAKKGTSKLWNSTKGYSEKKINEFKKSAKKAYENSRKSIHKILENEFKNARNWDNYVNGRQIFVSNDFVNNALEDYYNKEYSDVYKAYENSKKNGSFAKYVNLFIQMAQYSFSLGCSRYLKSIGMDDEVASFFKKIGINPKKK